MSTLKDIARVLRDGPASAPELKQEATGEVSLMHIEALLYRLRKAGKVRRLTGGRAGKWELLDQSFTGETAYTQKGSIKKLDTDFMDDVRLALVNFREDFKSNPRSEVPPESFARLVSAITAGIASADERVADAALLLLDNKGCGGGVKLAAWLGMKLGGYTWKGANEIPRKPNKRVDAKRAREKRGKGKGGKDDRQGDDIKT